MADTTIENLEVGRSAEGRFAVVAKQRRRNRNGDSYLALELSDTSGTIAARVWSNAEHFDRAIEVGDHVRAVGKPVLFRDEMQFDVRRLERIGAAGAASTDSFVPVARRELDELAGELDFLIDEVVETDLAALVQAIWRGADSDRLRRSPATIADHHAYLGGLVEHTVSVASLCLTACERHEHLHRDLLLTAALVHDIGRGREIDVASTLRVDDDAALYGHVLLGHEWLVEVAAQLWGDRRPDWWPALVHAVATHHGPLDRCRTKEAAALAAANALDVRLS